MIMRVSGKIKDDLEKIEAIEQFETRRSFLNKQKEKFEALGRHSRGNLL